MEPAATGQRAALLFTDVVDSVGLKTRHGTAAYADLIARHDRHFRALTDALPGAEIVADTGDGFLARFATTADAVRCALRFQRVIASETWHPEPLRVRVGIHLGEVYELRAGDDGRTKLVGLAADIANRLMALALPGQVLMTRAAFDDARQGVDASAGADTGPHERLRWMAHGDYLFQGTEDPIGVFEVGIAGVAPLRLPPTGGKARRLVPADEEELLGWRPAVGLDVPDRPPWRLERRLGLGGFGEVWLARHRATQAPRVFKFCFDADRLRSLKRELTLFRLLREALGDRDDIARLFDVRVDKPPYYLESEFTGLGSLADWAARAGGLDLLSPAERVALVARVADAVAAAHSVGILHKDIKPSNVLVYTDDEGRLRPRLADFGIGALANRESLHHGGVTLTGFTQSLEYSGTPGATGTQMYVPPETLAGRPFTVQGDVYALGVLLYQVVSGDLKRPLAPGWERDIDDREIRADIEICVDGDVSRRLGSAAELARRLRALDQRRQAHAQAERAALLARRRRRLARFAGASAILLLVLLVLVGFGLYRERGLRLAANDARDHAQRQAAKAAAVTHFLQNMLASAEPEQASRAELTLRELLDRSAADIDAGALRDEPGVEAEVRRTIGDTYRALGRYESAETQLRVALRLHDRLFGPEDPDSAAVRAALARALTERGEFDEADTLFAAALAAQDVHRAADPVAHARTLRYRAALQEIRGDYAAAESDLREALAVFERALGPRNPTTLAALEDLGLILRRRGDLPAAERTLRDVLAARRQLHGEDHVQVAGALNNLAALLQELGREDETEALLREAVDVFRKLYPDGHVSTARILTNLAWTLSSRGKIDEAEALLNEALAMRRRLLGEVHFDVATSLNELGTIARDRKDYAAAEHYARQAADIYRQTVGPDHYYTAVALHGLAWSLYEQRRFAEAEAELRSGLETVERALGPEHLTTARFRRDHGAFLTDLERYDEAERELLAAYAVLAAPQNEDPRFAVSAIKRLIDLYLLTRRWNEADAWRARLPEDQRGYAVEAQKRLMAPATASAPATQSVQSPAPSTTARPAQTTTPAQPARPPPAAEPTVP